ncbi:hypothetical protein OUZ56_022079 [Daphnia magna]|uniref:Uncharacterized protein n=1 Tax=Daphnia magna TaxID=35525 RepID=A0ABR0AVK2_9CRUS|nr:hypothetical protein OUZ56_022079 [Daphnia magna]
MPPAGIVFTLLPRVLKQWQRLYNNKFLTYKTELEAHLNHSIMHSHTNEKNKNNKKSKIKTFLE